MITRGSDQATDRVIDDGLYGPESVAWRLHADPSMVLAGCRALILQATHPVVMSGFHVNTAFADDPWGRLRRTGDWVNTVTYGTVAEAEKAGRVLRAIHAALPPGVEPESGRTYRVDDPDLLRWVHCTEVESFLSVYRRSGGRLRRGDGDRYVDEMRASARMVGLDPATVPASESDLADYYRDVRPELRVSAVSQQGLLNFLALPMPAWVRWLTPARPGWAGLVAIAFALLPPWARRLYRWPGLYSTDLAATAAARGVRSTLQLVPQRLVTNPARQLLVERTRAAGSAG